MGPKGTVKIKPKIIHGEIRCGDDSLYEGHILTVLDISTSNDGYLVLNKDKTGIGMVHINDTEWFKESPPDFLSTLMPLFERLQHVQKSRKTNPT